jgi:hypothetical protein
MDEPELERTPFGSSTSGGDGPPLVPIAIAGALIVALAGGAWWYLSRDAAPANTTPRAVTATEAPIAAPPPPPPLPPIAEMDPLMRSLIGALSSRPELARWLATDDLLQQTAAAIDQASLGKSNSKNFKAIAPEGPFLITRGNRRTIDPAGYRRYNGLVGTVTSIDASAAVKVYKTIRPRLNEAYQKMGHPGGDVDRAMDQALGILLETPVVRQPIAVVEGAGARWAYADPKLEALSQTQKQLLRMGPDHVDALLVWLRAFRAGIRQ